MFIAKMSSFLGEIRECLGIKTLDGRIAESVFVLCIQHPRMYQIFLRDGVHARRTEDCDCSRTEQLSHLLT